MTDECFDYSLCSNNGKTRFGGNVSESVARCLGYLSPILSNREIAELQQQANIAKIKAIELRSSNRHDFHPISNSLAKEFPIYAGLAYYPVASDFPIDGVYPGQFLGDIARVALLLHYLGHIESPSPTAFNLADFSRKVSKAVDDAKEPLYNTCSDFYSPDFDVDYAVDKLKALPSISIQQTRQRGTINALSPTLIKILQLLRPHINRRNNKVQARPTIVEDRKLTEIRTKIAHQTRNKINLPITDPITLGDNDQEAELSVSVSVDQTNSGATRTLNEHHHWIRYTDLISGAGEEKAIEVEAKAALEYLIDFTSKNIYQRSAQWLCVDLHLKLTRNLHLKLTHPLSPIMA